MKRRKHRYRGYSKRTIVLLIALFCSLFFGLGYSILSSGLSVSGEVDVDKFDDTLYGILRKAAKRGDYAKAYVGESKDSFIEEPSKTVYTWYANNTTQGNAILEKNNIIFANKCWQIIRTTDTGGVRVLYNGEEEDGKCLNTRGNHKGYSGASYRNLLTNKYWYGTDFEYDNDTGKYILVGDLIRAKWPYSDKEKLYGRYTCFSEDKRATCDSLYIIDSDRGSNNWSHIYQGNVGYQFIGKVPFNYAYITSTAHLALNGYTYGSDYVAQDTTLPNSGTVNFDEILTDGDMGEYKTLVANTYYSDSIAIDYSTGKYMLVNPQNVTSSSNYGSIKGKYTFLKTDENYEDTLVYFVLTASNGSSSIYTISMENYNLELPVIKVGTGITDNGNNTYTLTNVTSVSIDNFFGNNTYLNYYICSDGTKNTCDNVRKISSWNTNGHYKYTNGVDKVLIGKGYSGLNLTNTLLINKSDLMTNYGDYLDYKYICDSTANPCQRSKLRYVNEFNSSGYVYKLSTMLGNSVIWDGEKYTLVDTAETGINNHHYFCIDSSFETCEKVGYIYTYKTGMNARYNYLELSNGITSILEILEKMYKQNLYDSTVKKVVDAWYAENMLDYEIFLEDTIVCNNRSYSEDNLSYFNPDGGDITEQHFYFGEDSSLKCKEVTDQLSIYNDDAKLKYPVGMMTYTDHYLGGHRVFGSTESAKQFFLLGSYYLSQGTPSTLFSYTGVGSSLWYNTSGVRPVITLKPGMKYLSGTGTTEDPYIVDESLPGKSKLTINYYADDGKKIYKSYTTYLDTGSVYNITSPNIDYYIPDQNRVSGTLTENVTRGVTYNRISTSMTVTLVYQDGSQALEPISKSFYCGEPYAIEIPQIDGFVPSVGIIAGTKYCGNETRTVIYRADPGSIIIDPFDPLDP